MRRGFSFSWWLCWVFCRVYSFSSLKERIVSAVAIRLVALSRFLAFSKSMVWLQTGKTQLLLGSKLCSLSRSFLFVDVTGPNGMFAVANNTRRILMIGHFWIKRQFFCKCFKGASVGLTLLISTLGSVSAHSPMRLYLFCQPVIGMDQRWLVKTPFHCVKSPCFL